MLRAFENWLLGPRGDWSITIHTSQGDCTRMDEMGGLYGGEQKCIQGFGEES